MTKKPKSADPESAPKPEEAVVADAVVENPAEPAPIDDAEAVPEESPADTDNSTDAKAESLDEAAPDDEQYQDSAPSDAVTEIVTAPHPDHEFDEHHTSLAARSLQILGLLIVGGVIALWGGPKLAPMLPQGMAPIAQWLTPGSSLTERQIADLRAEFAAVAQSQTSSFDLTGVDARIESAPVLADLRDQIAALRTDLTSSATAPAEVAGRVDGLDTRVLGLSTKVDTLETQLRDLVVPGGELDSRTAAEITAYAATLDGLRAELTDLNTRLETQSTRIDSVSGDQRAQAQTAVATAQAQQNNARMQAAVVTLQAAVDAGEPYDTALTVFTDAGLDISAGLNAGAASGLVRNRDLLAQFPSLAHDAIRADTAAQGGRTPLGQFGAFLESQVATRALTPQEGSSADAILSRAEAALKTGDLELALREMRTLPAAAAEVFADWRRLANARLAALQGIAQLADAAKKLEAAQ